MSNVMTPDPAEPCDECRGWPGHHNDCSRYGEPRTDAGERLLRVLEDTIYKGARLAVGRAAIVAIEDEAALRAVNHLLTCEIAQVD
jgi:hypothetical protein